MKNVILFHGISDSSQACWLPYIKRELEKKGYAVSSPDLPDADTPDLKSWLPAALKEVYSPSTIIIAHSAGSQLTLSVLEKLNVRIHQVILVAGYGRRLPTEAPVLKETFEWEKIKANCSNFIFINSDNDPWGCTDVEGRFMLDHLGGKLVIPKGEGHMGSNMYNQPYKEFPFLLKLVD
jgi:predicted alpha/beta hydrolase family esterase